MYNMVGIDTINVTMPAYEVLKRYSNVKGYYTTYIICPYQLDQYFAIYTTRTLTSAYDTCTALEACYVIKIDEKVVCLLLVLIQFL